MPSTVSHSCLSSVSRWFLLGLVTMSAGCDKPTTATPSPQAAKDERVVPVTTVQPEKKTLRRVMDQPGAIEAFEETPLFARIPGYVQKVYVDIGDRVQGPRVDAKGKQLQPGQVLAELSVPEMEEELRQKQALVVQAEAEVEQTQGTLEAAEANVDTAKAMIREAEAARARAQATYDRWESEYKRMEGLFERKVIDAQTLDEARHQFKSSDAARKEVEAKVHSAQATARESEAKRNKARADIKAARARVGVAQAEAARLDALLQYGKIRAPFDGIVTRRNIHTGHFLQPASGSNAQPLFVVAQTDLVRVFVDVPESDALMVTIGMPARIRVQTIKDQDFKGKVTRTAWSLEPRSRTLRTEIDLPNPEGKLRPGMYAYVTLTVE